MSKQHQVTCVIYDKKGRVLSAGQNSYIKTHTLQAKHAKKVGLPDKQFLHAEVQAVTRCRNLTKAHKIAVFRYNAKGETVCAEPCKVCMSLIEELKIKVIEHT